MLLLLLPTAEETEHLEQSHDAGELAHEVALLTLLTLLALQSIADTELARLLLLLLVLLLLLWLWLWCLRSKRRLR